MRNTLLLSSVVGAAFGALCVAVLLAISSAFADQTARPQGTAANYSATCDFGGAAAQPIAVTGTAATATATGVGNVRIVCSQDTHYLQGLMGVTGVTALTGSTLLPANTIEYVNANRSTFSFLRDAVSGTCYLTECK